jgi:O-antigen ligase
MKGLLFTYALTFGAAVTAPFFPYYAFLVYVAFANLKPEALWPWSVPEGNYSRIVGAAFLVGWLLNGAGSARLRPVAPIVIALLFYWFWLFVGAWLTPAQSDARYTVIVLSKVFLPLLAGLTLINSLEQLKQLAWVLVITHGVLALQFNQQYYTYGINTDEWEFSGLDNNSIAITIVTALGLACFLAIASPHWWQKAIALVCAALMAHVVLFSMSRGGMLAMAVSGLVAFLIIPKRPVTYAAFAVAFVFVLILAGNEVQREFMSSFAQRDQMDASAQSRFQLTRDAVDCMLRYPVFGCGLENWGNVAPEYGWYRGKRAHNTWAEVGATMGIPGVTALLSFYGICAWQMLRVARSRGSVDPWIRWMATGIVIALAGFFASAWFVTVDRIELPFYVVLLGAGILKVLSLESAVEVAAPARNLLIGATPEPSLQPVLLSAEPR